MADGPTPVHRRIWRLAFLLSGSTDAAASLVTRIQKTHSAPASLEPALLDRVIIQAARSLPKSEVVNLPAPAAQRESSPLAARALSAALRLSHQPLEAWVLRRLDDLDELHTARAMDCSKTAARTHLTAAEESLASRLGDDLPAAITALRRVADSLDPAPFILDHRERTRLFRISRLKRNAIIGTAIALVLAYIVLQLIVSGEL